MSCSVTGAIFFAFSVICRSPSITLERANPADGHGRMEDGSYAARKDLERQHTGMRPNRTPAPRNRHRANVTRRCLGVLPARAAKAGFECKMLVAGQDSTPGLTAPN